MRFAPPTGRESHFAERKTTLRVTITTARSNFRLVRAFQWGEGGGLFLSNLVEFATRPFFGSFVNGNVIPVPFVRRKNLLTCVEWIGRREKAIFFPFSFGRGRRTFLIFDNLILLGLKFSKSCGKFPSRKKIRPSNLTQTRRFSNRRTNGNE